MNADVNSAAAIATSKLAAAKIHLFVPYNGKIADINESDTNKHTLDLEVALSETRKIIGLIFYGVRISGSGLWQDYPNEGVNRSVEGDYYDTHFVVIKDGSQRLEYAQSVANDDFDLYCFGYVVEV